MKVKVYDLPVRLFHWTFVGLFLGAFGIAKILEDESPFFSLHMLLGVALSAAVLMRLLWASVAGVLGSRYASFSALDLSPKNLINYLKGALTANSERTLRHNPASSWAIVLMILFALGLGLTGYLMTSTGNKGIKEAAEEVHEFLANGLLIVALAHVSGILIHTLRHREWIGLSMITGRRKAVEGEPPILRSYWQAATVYLLALGSVGLYLKSNYDPALGELRIFNQSLQLGEEKDHGLKVRAKAQSPTDSLQRKTEEHEEHEQKTENH